MLTQELKYKTGYRPRICTVSGTLLFIKKKDMDKYDRLRMTNRHKEKDKLVQEVFVYEGLTTLDENNEIPTQKLKDHFYKRVWSNHEIPGKLEDHNIDFVNVKVIMEHGRVSYDFDETKN